MLILNVEKDVYNTDYLYYVSNEKILLEKFGINEIYDESNNFRNSFEINDRISIENISIEGNTAFYYGQIVNKHIYYDSDGNNHSLTTYDIYLDSGQKIVPFYLISIEVALYNSSILEKKINNEKFTYHEFNDKLDVRSSFYLTQDGNKFYNILKYKEINNFSINDDLLTNDKLNVSLNYVPENIRDIYNDYEFSSNILNCNITIKKKNNYENDESINNRENIKPISLEKIKINNYLINKNTKNKFKILQATSLYMANSLRHFSTDFIADYFVTRIIGIIELDYLEKIIKIEIEDDISNWFLKEGEIVFLNKNAIPNLNPIAIFKILNISENKKFYILKSFESKK